MPTITMQDGAKITLPDGVTDEQIQEAAEDYTASLNAAPQGAANQLTPKQLDQKLPINKPTDIGVMPNGAPLPYGITQGMIDTQNIRNAQSNERNSAMRADPGLLERIAKANNEGMLANAGKSFMHTINQFGEGAEDLIDKYLPGGVSNIMNTPIADLVQGNIASPEQRMAERKQQMATEMDDQIARSIVAPVPSTIGSMAPYLLTGGAASKGIEAISSAASPITRQLIEKGLTKVSPIAGQRYGNLPRIPSEFGKRAGYMAQAPLIGAAEGGLNYDQTAGEGALYSTAGSALGLMGPLTKLSRVENVRDANSKAIIREMHSKGFALTPGVRTGNRAMQTEEAGIKNSDVLGDYYHQTVTRPNQRKITEMAGDAIGLNGKGRDTFSPDELTQHMDALRNGYKQLEANTNGVIGATQAKKMGDAMKELQPTANRNTSAADRARYDQVRSVIQQIRAETNPISHPGAPTVYGFDGAKYQQLRQRVSEEANQAFQSGDARLGNQLNKVREALDESLQNGMSKSTVKEWKDLNERYAMTNLLMKKGMTPQGAIDPMGITSAVMKDDEAIRTLTGKGGRIQNLQKIAKYNDVLNDVEGGSLTGLGKADMSADRSLTKLPIKYRLPLYARTTGAYRLGNIPIINPTIGFGPTAGAQVGRAIGMTEPLDKINRAAHIGAQEVRDWFKQDDEENK